MDEGEEEKDETKINHLSKVDGLFDENSEKERRIKLSKQKLLPVSKTAIKVAEKPYFDRQLEEAEKEPLAGSLAWQSR